MALLLLLPLVLSGVQGSPEVSLKGSPGDRVNLSCIGVSDPTRWAWAPSFPACKGLPKGRRPILSASPSGPRSMFPRFSGRLRPLDTGIGRLELLLSAGDSGSFFCKGRQESESRTLLQVLGDKADCSAPGAAHGSGHAKVLIPLLGVGLVLGLGASGWICWRRSRGTSRTGLMTLRGLPYRRSPPPPPPPPPRPLPTSAPVVNADPQRPLDQEGKMSGHPDQEPSLHYADLDRSVLGRPRRMSAALPGDARTVYAVVV
ncbi:megakaryocyte and platelet inhibitory receptor G6b isoform X2 [Meriones unguiculatus]|uniref:megakaryocyte and platelet inhibitory receptor G6b isoform X2 n=1 Tax=Meriones unguiculatus TaxID=10047 RepID=UPI00293F3D2F|nr:megakaryocyte and platelet inhibitory receptor G6b isoform X2 [Meriones unguiculatus]